MDFKPRPINKREFLAALPDPYQLPERDIQPYSNPNESYSSEVRPGQPEFNRALETSLKGDKTKTINIQQPVQNTNDNSTISINDLKDLQSDVNMPKRSGRKKKSASNTISLYI